MARRTITVLVSDLSGETADRTVPFGVDGVQYEIDLTDAEHNAFKEALATYLSAARRTGGRKRKVVRQLTDAATASA